MIFVVAGWLVVVGSVVGLITRPWKTIEARAPLALGLCGALGLWVLATGGRAYADLANEGLWTGATLTIIYVPFKAVVYALLGYYLGRAILNAWENVVEEGEAPPDMAAKWRTTTILATIVLFFVGSDIFTVREGNRQRTARDVELTPERIASLERRIILGRASTDEKYAFLENPLCPPSLLEDMANSPEQRTRLAVARNPALTPELATKLSNDADGEVRTTIAHQKALPLSQLQRLATDPYERVREAVAWKAALPDDDFARLTGDPSATVRATIVLQPRLSDADLRRLLADPDERVRTEAQKIAAQRGIN